MLNLDNSDNYVTRSAADTLVVLLHAYTMSPVHMRPVAARVQELLPKADLLVPKLPLRPFSLHDPERVAENLVEKIDACVDGRRRTGDEKGYETLIFIGHSFGAVLARKVWAIAHGATPGGGVDPQRARPWARQINRIVLLGAMARGWMISSAQGPSLRLLWTVGIAWGNLCRHLLRRDPIIFGIRRGAPFLTSARLQCLAVEDWHREQGDELPVTVQLLGTNDDFVAPSDNVDLATGGSFHYLEVRDASHSGIVRLEREDERRNFDRALIADPADLTQVGLPIGDVFDIVEQGPDSFDTPDALHAEEQPGQSGSDGPHSSSVDVVVFVVHGIRDNGFWTKRIARRIKLSARANNAICRTITSTYGYFPMGPFLLPWRRRAKAEWLLDQYVTARALYPHASFSFVGHSNGTYLLAKALELCPALRFAQVVFAGSVVRTEFDWKRFLPASGRETDSQVGRIVNYVATNDWIVAIFPNPMELLHLQDLGGAGHRGFALAPLEGRLVNVEHATGGHSAALAESYWDEIACFVLGGPMPFANRDTIQSPLARAAGLLFFLPWAFFLLLASLLPLGLQYWFAPSLFGWLFAIAIAVYFQILRVILIRW